MSAIASVLIGVAAEIGAPIVKGLLEKHVGGAAGEIGGAVIDAVAGKVGVTPEDLPSAPREELEKAVLEVEQETPALVDAWTSRLRESNRLQLAEMQSETSFGWLWRPAGMWLMLVCIAWYVMVVPLLNTVLTAAGAHTTVALIVDFGSFVTIFVTYCGLYMGGNTLLRSVRK